MFEPQQLLVLAILIISVPSAYLLVRYRKKVGRAAVHPLLKPFAIPVVVLWQLLMGIVRWFIPTRTQIVAMFVSTAFAIGFLIIKRVVAPDGPDPSVYQSGDLFAVLILLVVGFAYALATTPAEQNVTEHVEHLRGGFLHGYDAVLNYTEPKPVIAPKRPAFSWLLPRKKPVAPLVPVEPPRRIQWGGISLPWSSGNGHFVVAGVAGSGKTTLIRLFLQSTFPWI